MWGPSISPDKFREGQERNSRHFFPLINKDLSLHTLDLLHRDTNPNNVTCCTLCQSPALYAPETPAPVHSHRSYLHSIRNRPRASLIGQSRYIFSLLSSIRLDHLILKISHLSSVACPLSIPPRIRVAMIALTKIPQKLFKVNFSFKCFFFFF